MQYSCTFDLKETNRESKSSQAMKIAIASNNQRTISHHFGRADKYIVFTVEQEKIVERKVLSKEAHSHSSSEHCSQHRHKQDPRGSGFGYQSESKHAQMFKNIKDCDVIVAAGMGRGAYQGLQHLGIKPIITDISDIESAVQAILNGTMINHTERLH
jgi:predicted Fe-Mo cluster-binding NifX family protein